MGESGGGGAELLAAAGAGGSHRGVTGIRKGEPQVSPCSFAGR